MPIFRKESLETLRQRVQLIEVISPYVDLKAAGAVYKGLCPFHDEKTPSFTVHRGDSHYHCFGCGAHGDAIQFLMDHGKLNFNEAVTALAERFQVALEVVESEFDPESKDKKLVKEALEQATALYHFLLLHTPEGHEALHYLQGRGIDLDFVRQFRLGYAPLHKGLLLSCLEQKGVQAKTLIKAGLLREGAQGTFHEFFEGRILFPIHHSTGYVVGFSGRRFKEETKGGKYVNTPETLLFKKSQILFGLNYSRRSIAKEGRAILVEGQIDALSLIYRGVDHVVAGQGTAFGDSQAELLLSLGIKKIFLALDSDLAGLKAMVRIGELFQKAGVDTRIVPLPQGSDPDQFVRERGIEAFLALCEKGIDYLTFIFGEYAKLGDLTTPAGKHQLVQFLVSKIRSWEQPLLVHESLLKLAELAKVPPRLAGVGQEVVRSVFVKRQASLGANVQLAIDPDRIVESEFLRFLFSCPSLISLARQNISVEDLFDPICREVYALFLEEMGKEKGGGKLSFFSLLKEELQPFVSDLLNQKKEVTGRERYFQEIVQKMLDRKWMHACEKIREEMSNGGHSGDREAELFRAFNSLKRERLVVKVG